jgi:hypothetical protein
MAEIDFLRFKERNILELLEQLELTIKIGEENIEHLVQVNPDLNRLIGARQSLEISKKEFEDLKRELSQVRESIRKI